MKIKNLLLLHEYFSLILCLLAISSGFVCIAFWLYGGFDNPLLNTFHKESKDFLTIMFKLAGIFSLVYAVQEFLKEVQFQRDSKYLVLFKEENIRWLESVN